MRDSWIDRDELDELVGSFSPARKGKGRRPAVRPKKAATEPAAGDPEVGTPPTPFDPSEAIAESPSSPHGTPSVAPSLIEVPETVSLAIFEFDDESDEDFDPVEALTDGMIEIEILETFDAAEAYLEKGEVPPPLPECVDELPVPIGSGEEASEEIAVVGEESEPAQPTEPILPWEEFENSLPESAPKPELIVSAVPAAEVVRELPLFLDDSDDFVPRNPSLSERDADRALIALAEARAKVEQGRLLRIHREAPEPDEIDPSSREEAEPELQETPPPHDGAMADVNGDVVAPAAEDAPVEAAAAEPLTLTERIEQYVVRARTELGASAAAISDRDGFLLFAQSESGSDADLETALLLEVAGKTDLLLGLEHGRATQVSTDGGAWRCLIRGGEGVAELYAGFRMPRPLDQEEIARWRKALAEVLSTPLE